MRGVWSEIAISVQKKTKLKSQTKRAWHFGTGIWKFIYCVSVASEKWVDEISCG